MCSSTPKPPKAPVIPDAPETASVALNIKRPPGQRQRQTVAGQLGTSALRVPTSNVNVPR